MSSPEDGSPSRALQLCPAGAWEGARNAQLTRGALSPPGGLLPNTTALSPQLLIYFYPPPWSTPIHRLPGTPTTERPLFPRLRAKCFTPVTSCNSHNQPMTRDLFTLTIYVCTNRGAEHFRDSQPEGGGFLSQRLFALFPTQLTVSLLSRKPPLLPPVLSPSLFSEGP